MALPPQLSSCRRLCLAFGAGLAVLCMTAGPHANADEPTLRVSGSHRQLFEYLINPFRPGRLEDEAIINMRTNVLATLSVGGFELGAELNDARVYGAADPQNVTPAMVNAVEPLQYYLKYSFKHPLGEGSHGYVQAGRFTYDLGTRRIIGRQRYRNSINSFLGVAGALETAQQDRIDAFWLYPSRIEPRSQDGLTDNDVEHDRFDDDLRFAGVFLKSARLVPGTILQGFFVDLSEADTPGKVETRDRRLRTLGLGARKRRAAGRVDFDIEGALQWGHARQTANPLDTSDLAVRAGFLHVELGYSFGHEGGVNLALTYDFASGDKDPTDERSGRYDPIFGPIRGDVGPTGLFTLVHRENISAPGVRVIWKPAQGYEVMAHWQAIWLDHARDLFGRIRVRDITGQSGRFAGHQLQMRTRFPTLWERLKLEVGAAFYLNGRFFDQAPNATGNGNPAFLYTMAQIAF